MKPFLAEEIKQITHAELLTPLGRGLVTGVSTDSRRIKPGDLFVALRGEHFDGHDFIDQAVTAGAKTVLVEGKPVLSEFLRIQGTCVMRVNDTIKALGELARSYRRGLEHSITMIAVTGSNGKTTTREMIYHVLSRRRKGHRSPASYNNAVGVPLTLFGMEPDNDFAVVELGSSAPGEIAELSRITEPDIAVITSVSATHLEGLKTVDQVSREKLSVVAGLTNRGALVCPTDHDLTLERALSLGRQIITFGLEPGAAVSAHDIAWAPGSISFETNDRCRIELPLAGIHNVRNALAALATVRRLGVTSAEFAQAVKDFQPIDARMVIKHINGLVVIDDSYNANPASMSAALTELVRHRRPGGRLIMVCGDMCELGVEAQRYHSELGRQIAAAKIDLLFTVGDLAAIAATSAVEMGMPRGLVQRAINSRRLARLIKASLRDGDVICVKGSRAMKMETIIKSMERYRGGRKLVVRVGKIQTLPATRGKMRLSQPSGQPRT
ncbi:MAG: UDP-N-acetylmuramoyl-tripeptide--D-alanyl-D-alanine ligase [Sedimentisphaerales bacterium]|nr:UDP-N-acetylmuramoyl-tripeptide--D-alanyl-D-alanine ligase [Sedimentisphaerales bacterium]